MKPQNMTDREGWVGKLDFILTCIGYAVGLGNIWRFPYLCYKSGGGAFLIPYSLFLILCGLPLFFLEVTYGQFSSLSPVAIWKVTPLFKGVGIGMNMISGIVCIYYNVIIAWTLYYLFLSFRAALPWSHCGNDWNTIHCKDDSGFRNLTSNTDLLSNLNQMVMNKSGYENNQSEKYVSASEEFWERYVLDMSRGIDSPGNIRWHLFICLAVSWLCVFMCLFKGVKILGKVWGDAALQIFYSVGMAWGGIITMASYNKFNHNVYRDSMLVPVINCGTSLFAGFVIFSVLGYMAHELNTSVDEIVTQGPGLTFVAYPQAIATMPLAPLWSVLFFLMLFTVGLDSQFGMFETIISSIIDEFPEKLRHRKTVITALACFIEFLLGISCITQGGIYVLQILDWYSASFSLMLISLTECLALAWAYGVDNLYRDIILMTGKKPHFWWRYMWKFVTPTVIIFIWTFSVITLGPVTYGPNYKYPYWAIILGWLLAVISVLPIPVVALYKISSIRGSFRNRLKKLLRPDPSWGPSRPEDHLRYIQELEKTKKVSINGSMECRSYSISMGDSDESSVVFIPKN
ncbi:sodium-dependent proline transporter-like isoform X2 [Biomphalaria glabrata]|uniref:Transporter n=1 Tax=Biomphalaria glabrata TaxID=6526 RepID=A0A9W3B619_BIOGL|nr:sodium-dependent proline transporter-like isoform X2 [Biomphalaria glabrata]